MPLDHRWQRYGNGVTDGRYVIRRDSPETLRERGAPAWHPWSLWDRNTYVGNYLTIEYAQREATP